jgi:transcriptional regulator with XRE-family HTH domain
MPPKRLGLVLKTLRKLAGLSQRALAKSAHTTAGYVAIQEAGQSPVLTRLVPGSRRSTAT